MKPFIKWAGGKGQLLPIIKEYYPSELGRSVGKYAEPFVGGGAVLFDILSNYDMNEVYISDTNAELINVYMAIRNNVEILLHFLEVLQREYLQLDTSDRESYYYEKRVQFNSLKSTSREAIDTEQAALFIFLNKTCFNGLYRVNKKGEFNVPMGRYKNPCICDCENLFSVANALKKVKIVCTDYSESATFIDENTFAYFDPPYRPLTITANFTSYTNTLFDDNEQLRLSKFVTELTKKAAKVVVSNSDPKNVDTNDDFFDRLYASSIINRVEATRVINMQNNKQQRINQIPCCLFY